MDDIYWMATTVQLLAGLLALPVPTSPLSGPLCSLCLCGEPQLPPAAKIGEHQYRIGSVTVDTAQMRVRVPCRVNMSRGMIEYLAVATEGKRHESVLLVEAEPLHVHLALLLLGLEPGPRPRYQGGGLTPAFGHPSPSKTDGEGPAAVGGAGQPRPKAGGQGREQYSVDARVVWRAQGRDHAARLEELAWDIPARRPMEPVAWVFTGVGPPRSGPRTMEERSVVATYRDPDAVLNNPLPTGADDTVYKVNERLVPPVGTPVTLWLSPTASGG